MRISQKSQNTFPENGVSEKGRMYADPMNPAVEYVSGRVRRKRRETINSEISYKQLIKNLSQGIDAKYMENTLQSNQKRNRNLHKIRSRIDHIWKVDTRSWEMETGSWKMVTGS